MEKDGMKNWREEVGSWEEREAGVGEIGMTMHAYVASVGRISACVVLAVVLHPRTWIMCRVLTNAVRAGGATIDCRYLHIKCAQYPWKPRPILWQARRRLALRRMMV